MPINHAGGHGAGRKDARPDERPAIEINRGRRHLAAGYFVWLFQQNNNDLNFTRRLARLLKEDKREEKTKCRTTQIELPSLVMSLAFVSSFGWTKISIIGAVPE